MNIEQAVWHILDNKTKPRRSLGRLETLAAQLCMIQQTLEPNVAHARIIVFSADHGIADEDVSAYPKAVTAEMMRNFDRGGAAVSVLAHAAQAEVEIIDVGVDADIQALQSIVHDKVRHGSRNMLHEPAMTSRECDAAIQVGRKAAQRAADAGVKVLGLGDMGIGNTTASAALLSALTGASSVDTVGRGTGVDDQRLAHKQAIVDSVLMTFNSNPLHPRQSLATFGGLEIAALAGAIMAAPAHKLCVIIDGFIVTVAALAAVMIDPGVHPYLVFAHRSQEHGHKIALEALNAHPLLDLDLRLGEGSGAALAIPLIRSAVAILRDMASFDSAGVSRSEHEDMG